MHASHFVFFPAWGSWKPNIHCYKPSAVETMTLLQTLGRRIQQHCCKPSAVEPRHCYGFSAMIPFCATFPKDSKSTALGLLGIYIYIYNIYADSLPKIKTEKNINNIDLGLLYSYNILVLDTSAMNKPP